MSKIVCIDPGHSGAIEPGAVCGPYTEAAIVMAIAMDTAAAVQAAGYDVLLTRRGNIDTDDLQFRSDMANEAAADVFVSIHCNSFTKETARGVEVFHYPGSMQGHQLAVGVYLALANEQYTLERGVKTADFAVLRLTDMPAILVECAFLSNEEDRAVLTSAAGRQMLARQIAKGIDQYFKEL